MTLQQLLTEGTQQLNEAGIQEADLDARYLLLDAFGMSYMDFLLKRNCECQEIADEQANTLTAERSAEDLAIRYQCMLEKRCKRIPLQYIIKSQMFMGLEFMVDERVLIPRQDTEDLVELILKEHEQSETSVLDMCTGSGCIGISLAKLGGYKQVTVVDISTEALGVVEVNEKKHQVEDQLTIIRSDLYQQSDQLLEICPDGYDVIVSNPPYIPTKIIAGLQPEVKEFEPMLALDGTEDGLYFYRKLAKESGKYLRPGGMVYFEIGYDQGEAVKGLLADAGYADIEVIKDTPGLDRIVKAKGGLHV